MIRFGVDFELVSQLDGSLDVDFGSVISENPIVIVNRCLYKIVADIGDYWWNPTVGTGITVSKGQDFQAEQLQNLSDKCVENMRSDPQVQSATCNCSMNDISGVLTISPSITINYMLFQPTISIDGQTILAVLNA